MKKQDLRETLKPLIREAVREIVFEEGLLAGIVAEVITGVNAVSTPTPQPRHVPRTDAPPVVNEMQSRQRQQAAAARSARLEQQKQQVLESINRDSYNGVDLFEGTTPIDRAGVPGQASAQSGPLSGQASNDPGVDLSAFFGASQNWSKLV